MAPHRVLTPLRWSDMDANGHVNNVQFLRLLEDARVVALHSHGAEEGGILVDTGLIVVRHEIEYVLPLVYSLAPVAIDLWITEIGGASFVMAAEVRDEAPDGVLYARAESTMVVIDRSTGRPRRLAPQEREKLADWTGDQTKWRRRSASS